MKKQVKLNEAQLRNIVAECVKKTLKEFISPVQPATDYEGNDLNYEHLFDEALKVIDEMNDGVTEIRWQDVAQRMGYHLDTLNEDDMELLHDAIEDAMAVPGIEEEPIQVNETKIAKIVAESVKRTLNEISQGLVDRARDAAFNDMKNNWNNPKIRTKREGQWKNFSNAAIDMEREEKNSVCPEVPASELYNMPPETCVVMDGAGRDGYSNFIYRYSGHAGTKEQCEEFVNRFYDKGADWEFMPEIFTLEEYIRYKKQHPYC